MMPFFTSHSDWFPSKWEDIPNEKIKYKRKNNCGKNAKTKRRNSEKEEKQAFSILLYRLGLV